MISGYPAQALKSASLSIVTFPMAMFGLTVVESKRACFR